ncbi:MAG: 3-oxoadipate enol-lactonase [Alphaproteobacteria bacterium]|nr:3-oxoadipate enol-lactonase [Alphaproteobacteria bacterium]
MAIANVNGTCINYELTGPEGAAVVTMSHSLSATYRMWDPQMKALAAYRVLRFDTRGHGGSAAPDAAYTLDQLAEDAYRLITSLGIRQTHFMGLSMGGMIAQTLALAHPEILKSLILCDTASGYPAANQAMWAERIETARKTGLGGPVEGTIDRWFSPGFVAKNAAAVDPVRAMIKNTPKEGYIGCCQAISKLNLTNLISQIKLPTLIIVGSDDPGTPVAMHEIINQKIRGSELVILPGARHLPNIELADAFNKALTGFLAKH